STNTFLYENISRIITILFLFFTFMLFRARGINDIYHFAANFLSFDTNIIGVPIFTQTYFFINFLLILFVILSDIILEKGYLANLPFKTKINYSYMFFTFVLLSVLFLGIFEEQSF